MFLRTSIRRGRLRTVHRRSPDDWVAHLHSSSLHPGVCLKDIAVFARNQILIPERGGFPFSLTRRPDASAFHPCTQGLASGDTIHVFIPFFSSLHAGACQIHRVCYAIIIISTPARWGMPMKAGTSMSWVAFDPCAQGHASVEFGATVLIHF